MKCPKLIGNTDERGGFKPPFFVHPLTTTYFIVRLAMSPTSQQSMRKVLLERFPYRYTDNGVLENGCGDYRIQKYNHYDKRYEDMYLLDNSYQLTIAIEDENYTRWLDPEGVPCYVRDRVVNVYEKNRNK